MEEHQRKFIGEWERKQKFQMPKGGNSSLAVILGTMPVPVYQGEMLAMAQYRSEVHPWVYYNYIDWGKLCPNKIPRKFEGDANEFAKYVINEWHKECRSHSFFRYDILDVYQDYATLIAEEKAMLKQHKVDYCLPLAEKDADYAFTEHINLLYERGQDIRDREAQEAERAAKEEAERQAQEAEQAAKEAQDAAALEAAEQEFCQATLGTSYNHILETIDPNKRYKNTKIVTIMNAKTIEDKLALIYNTGLDADCMFVPRIVLEVTHNGVQYCCEVDIKYSEQAADKHQDEVLRYSGTSILAIVNHQLQNVIALAAQLRQEADEARRAAEEARLAAEKEQKRNEMQDQIQAMMQKIAQMQQELQSMK